MRRARKSHWGSAVLKWAALLTTLAGGTACQPKAPPPVPVPSQSIDDPCVDRLHELAGELLVYFIEHRSLPASLSDLAGASQVSESALRCPVSGRQYLYNPDGIHIPDLPKIPFAARGDAVPPGRPEWLIVYDAQPVHDHHRWGIVVTVPEPGTTFATEVVAIQDNVLRRALMQRAVQDDAMQQ